MSRWAYLGLAIISEVIATTSLKSTEGFTKFLPSTIVVIGYCAAFYFLSLTLDSIPIGVVYAIWSGAGIVGIAILSWIIYGQNLDLGTGIGMALIIAGIIVMRLYSNVDFA
ncbi:MAG: DMT family transporter [Candidatus Thalassarchaeaceae archaeon]|jgi:small multidrug resistance pump|nr:MAG: QacE family quaternary ammonium compound efflux SMR transporter [Euryarchaeota archaeon]RPG76372.1 MAG: QacE family quaternary ammonium compound efflux SMR transporter [Euryarchaeota archaeon TMED85]|tara:strand:+ start:8277 stop:8609 length:333 start_codon:yes stop_codon:yes gene_type:complete